MDRSRRFFLFGLALVVVFFALLRWPMLDAPMERDEGEYATMGLGMLHGIPPYSEAYTMKPPGTAALYALLIRWLGPTPRAIHMGLLIINALNIALVGFIGKNLMGGFGGVFAAAAYGTFTIGVGMFGYWLSAEHFAVFFMLSGALILMRNAKCEMRNFFPCLGAFLLGCSVMVKPHAAPPAAAWLLSDLCSKFRWADCSTAFRAPKKQILILHFTFRIIPFILPTLIVMAWMRHAGVWQKFRFWTWDYAKIYATAVPLSRGWEYFKIGGGNVFWDAPLLWILALGGLMGNLFLQKNSDAGRKVRIWLGPATLASFLSVSMGLLFRGQYFILAVPMAALLAAKSWEMIHQKIGEEKRLSLLSKKFLLGFILIVSFINLYEPVMGMDRKPSEVCRLVYGMNPFPESPSVAEHLKQITAPGDKIAVLGSEPQIYFLADRRPAIPYLYMYEAMKPHPFAASMQKEIIQDLETSNPKALVFVQVPTSWGGTSQSDPALLRWLTRFIPQHDRLEGVVDLVSETQTIFRWGNSAQTYHPKSPYYLLIFLRKD